MGEYEKRIPLIIKLTFKQNLIRRYFMNPNIIPITILGIFLAFLWLSTTVIFVRMVRRNDKISESAKTIWSIVILVYWFVGAFGYIIWNIIWQISEPKTTTLTGISHESTV